MTWRILEGDCIPAMAELPEASVDAVVCDPPYGIRFMGQAWDGADQQREVERRARLAWRFDDGGSLASPAQAAGIYDQSPSANRTFQEWCEGWGREALRVLKPGGHLLAFGGTRTYHRLACAVEDAGFEIRDCLAWLYGSGFPKSLDVSKAIDKAAGAEREVVCREDRRGAFDGLARASEGHSNEYGSITNKGAVDRTAPATPDAKRWQGWGTALKPAHEPIVMARKPLVGTVSANVLEHGTGALNIDGCRIEATDSQLAEKYASVQNAGPRDNAVYGRDDRDRAGAAPHDSGRWPANVTLDEAAAALLDEQTGECRSAGEYAKGARGGPNDFQGPASINIDGLTAAQYSDSGGASRFFYVPKADTAERNAGLSTASLFTPSDAPDRNDHPTVKPIDLMRWLVRLVTPPGGVVLDPFAGSGSTGCAALLEGFSFIGIEREPAYAAIARARLAYWSAGVVEAA